jgi:hypothetical protein
MPMPRALGQVGRNMTGIRALTTHLKGAINVPDDVIHELQWAVKEVANKGAAEVCTSCPLVCRYPYNSLI